MVLFNQEAINSLIEEANRSEKGISSYWIDLLQGFEFKDGKFDGKGLPEGEGGYSRSLLGRLIHYLLQTPFRLKGQPFSEFNSLLKTAKQIHENRNNGMRLGTLRQAISLSLLEQKIQVSQLNDSIVVIGDGFAVMSSLILLHFPKLKGKLILVNLTQNLLIDAVFLQKSVPHATIALVKNEEEIRESLDNSDIQAILIQADNAKLISHAPIGLAINIASMQEMNPEIIANYFSFMRGSKNAETYFYCVNRIEKILPDNTVVKFFEYPWDPHDQILVDELCPWHQNYYRVFPPFYLPYDGPHQHRLVLMNKSSFQ